MKRVDLSIVIVSYNTSKLTVECLESIIKTINKVSYEIIVVDNKSSDDSVKEIQKAKGKSQKYKSKIKIIGNEENFGFSKANNIGVKESSGRYVLFLNSDTVVHENTLDEMVNFMDDHPKAGAATCKVIMPNGQLDDACHRGFPTPMRSFLHFSGVAKVFPKSKTLNGYNLGWKDIDQVHEIEALAGAFMIVRRKAGEELGWWDEDFFWYGEDLDFCYRLIKNRWKIYFVPHVTILHYKGASGGIKKVSKQLSTANASTKTRATNARFNAMKIFYNKHYKGKYPGVVNFFVLSGIQAKWAIAKILQRN